MEIVFLCKFNPKKVPICSILDVRCALEVIRCFVCTVAVYCGIFGIPPQFYMYSLSKSPHTPQALLRSTFKLTPLRRNMSMLARLLLIAAVFAAPCDAAPRGFAGRVPQRTSFEPTQRLNRRVMTHVEPSPAACEACAIVETIPRGGAQKSISVKTEGGNALVAGILNGVGKISPTLAGLLKVLFKIVESLTGLDLVPVKVVEKAKKSSRSSGSKKKSSKSKKSRATVAEDESSDDEEAEPVKAPPKKKKAADGGGGSGGGSAAAKKHLATSLKSTSPNYRIQKELKQFLSSPPPNLKVSVGKNIRVWIVTFKMPEDTIYAGEKYRLRIQFPADYPHAAPECVLYATDSSARACVYQRRYLFEPIG